MQWTCSKADIVGVGVGSSGGHPSPQITQEDISKVCGYTVPPATEGSQEARAHACWGSAHRDRRGPPSQCTWGWGGVGSQGRGAQPVHTGGQLTGRGHRPLPTAPSPLNSLTKNMKEKPALLSLMGTPHPHSAPLPDLPRRDRHGGEALEERHTAVQ